MSQLLVALNNKTNVQISFANTEDSYNNLMLNPGEMVQMAKHFNIPDDSNPSEYFTAHHMSLASVDPNSGDTDVIFSFWDNDDDHYNLYFCPGLNPSNAAFMPGYYNGGNNATVGITISGSPGNYSLEAYQVSTGK